MKNPYTIKLRHAEPGLQGYFSRRMLITFFGALVPVSRSVTGSTPSGLDDR